MSRHIYPDDLEEDIRTHKYIPRRCKVDEKLRLNHRYWIPDYKGFVKVYDIFNADGTEYYSVRFDGNMNAAIPHPIDDDFYELLHDYDEIEKQKIINSDKSYSGAEIKFWFVYQKIDLSSKKYKGYWTYFNPDSKYLLVDNKYYKVSYIDGIDKPCQIKLTRS